MAWTRRRLLAMVVGALGPLVAPVPAWAKRMRSRPPPWARGHVIIYRFSVRGRRGSRAAKIHAANLRFATRRAAERHRAHPGDNSRIVPLTVSVEEFRRLFVARRRLFADLRKL